MKIRFTLAVLCRKFRRKRDGNASAAFLLGGRKAADAPAQALGIVRGKFADFRAYQSTQNEEPPIPESLYELGELDSLSLPHFHCGLREVSQDLRLSKNRNAVDESGNHFR